MIFLDRLYYFNTTTFIRDYLLNSDCRVDKLLNSISLTISNYKARLIVLSTIIIAGLLEQMRILLHLFHPIGSLAGVYFDQNWIPAFCMPKSISLRYWESSLSRVLSTLDSAGREPLFPSSSSQIFFWNTRGSATDAWRWSHSSAYYSSSLQLEAEPLGASAWVTKLT